MIADENISESGLPTVPKWSITASVMNFFYYTKLNMGVNPIYAQTHKTLKKLNGDQLVYNHINGFS